MEGVKNTTPVKWSNNTQKELSSYPIYMSVGALLAGLWQKKKDMQTFSVVLLYEQTQQLSDWFLVKLLKLKHVFRPQESEK